MRRKNKENEDSSGNELQHNSDPVIQKKDESKIRRNKAQPKEKLKSKNAASVSEVKVMPRQSSGIQYSDQTARSGNDILKSMLHFKWTIVLIFIITAVPMIAFIWTQIIPKYQAKAQIHIRPDIPYIVFKPANNGMIPSYNAYLNTQVSYIRSTEVLQRVVEDPEIQKTKWYKIREQSLISKLHRKKVSEVARLRDNLSVRPINQTEIIDVSFIASNAGDAANIVNAVLEKYLGYLGEMSNSNEDTIYAELTKQKKTLESEISTRETAITELVNSIRNSDPNELVTGNPQELVMSKRANIEQIQQRLSEVQQKINLLEWDQEELKREKNEDGNDVRGVTAEQPQIYEEDSNDIPRLTAEQPHLYNEDGNDVRGVTAEQPDIYEEDSNDVPRVTAEQPYLYEEDGNDVRGLTAEQPHIYEEDSNDVLVGIAEEPPYYKDAEWRQLEINVKTIKHQIKTSLLTDSNPDMAKMNEDLEFAEELLENRESQLDKLWKSDSTNMKTFAGTLGPNYSEQLENIRYQIERAQKEKELLNYNLQECRTEFEDTESLVKQIETQKNDLSHNRELFDAVRQRLEQQDRERNAPRSIEKLSRAFVPGEYFNDRRGVYTAMALFMAFGLGCGVAFLKAYKNQLIFAAEDIPLPARVPQLGFLPLINLKKSLGKPLCDEIEKSQFLLVESVRVMRTTLLSKLENQKSAVVLISSSTAGTGKSSLTRILGKSMAQAGKEVLMIDADFHKRTLTKWFNLVDKPGFLDCLSSETSEEIEMFSTESPKMKFLPAGTRNKNFVFEEIANGTFRTYIDRLRKQFSIVLLDCSPVVPIADATIISGQVDGTIMVERELVSRRENVINAVARLGSANGRLLGMVFVGSPDEKTYGYGYEDYYRTERN